MADPVASPAFGAILKWLGDHLSFRYFSMLFFMCIAFVFGINPALEYLRMPVVAPADRRLAVVGAVLASGLMLSAASARIWTSISSTWKAHLQQKAVRDHLRNLPVDQKRILLPYAQKGKSSSLFDEYNGAVCDLVRRGILYRSSNVAHRGLGVFPYTLTDYALRCIQQSEFQEILLAKETGNPTIGV